jgi:hypothetical protein
LYYHDIIGIHELYVTELIFLKHEKGNLADGRYTTKFNITRGNGEII